MCAGPKNLAKLSCDKNENCAHLQFTYGARDGLGYFLFSFETPVGYLGNNQYRRLERGHALASQIVRMRRGRELVEATM